MHLRKRPFLKLLSILIIIIFFNSTILYSQPSEHLAAKDRILINNSLAAGPMSAPMCRVIENQDGTYDIENIEDLDDVFTEVMLVYAAHLAVYSFSDESVARMVRETNFFESRIGYMQKIDGSVYAFYQRESVKDPEVVLLKFSKIGKNQKRRSPGAIIELTSGERVFIEILTLDDIPDGHYFKKKDFSPMQNKDYREGFRMFYEVSRAVLDGGNPERGAELFFASAAFQGENLNIFGHICNRFIEEAYKNGSKRGLLKVFFKYIISGNVALSEKSSTSRALQLMAGQALTIISWIDRGVKGAEKLRINMEPKTMARNKKRGWSYIDSRTLPKETPHVTEEGAPGFYWRGIELVSSKLKGENLRRKDLVFDEDLFEKADDCLMYTMNHGFIKVPKNLLTLTEKGKISTIHETVFINDFVPGSFQTTSTGAGHFQGAKIDVKQVTEGRGVQFNVKYDDEGNIVEVIAHEVKKDDWTFAFPGYVDYVVNLGGLRFNDVSIELDPKVAAKFNRGFNFGEEHIHKMAELIPEAAKAPYLGAVIDQKEFIVKNLEEAPEINWVSQEHAYRSFTKLIQYYPNIGEVNLPSFVEGVLVNHDRSISIPEENVPRLLDETILDEAIARGRKVPSMNKTKEMIAFIDENTAAISANKRDIVIRIPVEFVDGLDSDNYLEYLNAIQDSYNFFIELYSKDTVIEISDDKYLELGIKKKPLPEKTKNNTITLFPVNRIEEISAKDLSRERIGGINPNDTLFSPIGENYDRLGLVRGLVFGLGLIEIANLKGRERTSYARKFLEKYRNFVLSQGVREREFVLRENDLVRLATSTINAVAKVLRKVIKSLPVVPLNPSELKDIYDHTVEALKHA